MLDPAKLIIYTDAQIDMAWHNIKWSTIHFMSSQQGIPFIYNMHDMAFMNVIFHLPLRFPVTQSIYVLLQFLTII